MWAGDATSGGRVGTTVTGSESYPPPTRHLAMTDIDELERLSSKELHDRAFSHAKRHMDARFFFELIEMIPAAETASGDVEEAEEEVLHPSRQVAAAVGEDPVLIDRLRPLYIDYLREHPDA